MVYVCFVQIIFRLAQLYYEHQKLDYCEELCLKILQLHPKHTAASLVRTRPKRHAPLLFAEIHLDMSVLDFVLSCWLMHYFGRTKKKKQSRFMPVLWSETQVQYHFMCVILISLRY